MILPPVSSNSDSPVVTNELLLYRLQQAELHIDSNNKAIGKLKSDLQEVRDEEADRERRYLKWGIMTLGMFVSTLVGIIWANKGVLFK